MEIEISPELKLVFIEQAYAEEMHKAFDKDVIKYLPNENPNSNVEVVKTFITEASKRNKTESDFTWAILHKNKFAGCVGLLAAQTTEASFGLWLRTSMQGKGFGKRIAKKTTQWAFNNLPITSIAYPTDKRNTPSLKIVNHLGGEFRDEKIAGANDKLIVHTFIIHKDKFLENFG